MGWTCMWRLGAKVKDYVSHKRSLYVQCLSWTHWERDTSLNVMEQIFAYLLPWDYYSTFDPVNHTC